LRTAPRRGPRAARYFAAASLLVLAVLATVAALRGGGGQARGGNAKARASAVAKPSATTTTPSNGSAHGARATGKVGALPSTQSAGANKLESAAGAAAAGAHASGKAPASASRSGAETHGAVTVAEVRDPEESKSFPLPASVHHRSASSPSVAGEAAVAPGAASDAQIRKELGEEQQAEAQARAAQPRVLTPVAGGFSVGGNGTIPIPSGVPEVVQRVVAGGNAIADFPYIWGGGHTSFIANGYDCSGSVSYALAAGGLLSVPLVSGDLANWGEPGPGRWITIYANAGHTFMDVDGMWFDTAGRSGPYASRWLVSTPSLAGYAVRHPAGL
jgi:cell wall-associated NlpC family hydrolase